MVVSAVSLMLLLQQQTTTEPQAAAASKAFKKLPPAVRSLAMKGADVDTDGNVGFNKKNGWTNVADQRALGFSILLAMASDDRDRIDRSLEGIRETYRHMNPNGSFETNARDGAEKKAITRRVHDNLFWLMTTAPALYQLGQWDAKYKPQIEELKGPMRKAADFAYDNRRTMYDFNERNANRMLGDAVAFAYLAKLYNNADFKSASEDFTKKSLAMQSSDGGFLETDGADSSYQSVSLYQLGMLYYAQPTPEVKMAMRKGAEWFLDKFRDDGKIDVRGNSRTAIGRDNVKGGKKLGHNAPQFFMTLAVLQDLLPDTKAGKVYESFLKVAFDGTKLKKPDSYIYGGDGGN